VNVRVTVQTVFSVKLEWASGSGATKGYKVAYALSPSTPSLSAAVDVGNVTSYWVYDVAASTAYNFRVWAYDRKGNSSSGVTVAGSTLPLPLNCLSYVRIDGYGLSHAAYDRVHGRLYAVGLPGWNIAARNASDLSPVQSFGTNGLVTTHDFGYAISAAADSLGNVYMSGVGSPDGGLTTGFMIQKVDAVGNVVWTTTGPNGYECTEVRTNIEEVNGEPREYVYGLGYPPAGTGPFVLVKLDLDTGEAASDFGFRPGNAATAGGGNAETMAIGSDGIYLPWHDDVLNLDLVSKFGFNGQLLAQASTGSFTGQGTATGYWKGQEWVWVALPNEIRRYDTNLVEADISEAGLGCHKVDPTPYGDYSHSLRVVNDDTGRALLYVSGKTFGVGGGADGFVSRFQMTDTQTIAENGPGGLFDIADHAFDWSNDDALSSIVVDEEFNVFVTGRHPTQIFKFSGF
jgi:hypothetical protein